jgi:hypothetical protein
MVVRRYSRAGQTTSDDDQGWGERGRGVEGQLQKIGRLSEGISNDVDLSCAILSDITS